MHGSALSRPQWRTRRSRHLWPRTLENRLPGHRTARRRPHGRAGLCAGLNGFRRRRLVDRSRPRLRNNHAWRRRRWRRRLCRRGRYGLRRWSTRSRWWCNWRSSLCGRLRRRLRRRCGWSCRSGCRCGNRGLCRCSGWYRRTHDRSWRPRSLRGDETWRWRRRRRRFRCGRWRSRSRTDRRRSGWLRFNWRRPGSRRARRCSRRNGRRCLLLLRDQLQHIAWFGDMRQVDLCLDLV